MWFSCHILTSCYVHTFYVTFDHIIKYRNIRHTLQPFIPKLSWLLQIPHKSRSIFACFNHLIEHNQDFFSCNILLIEGDNKYLLSSFSGDFKLYWNNNEHHTKKQHWLEREKKASNILKHIKNTNIKCMNE